VVFVLIPVGVLWSLINAAINRERKANLVGLATGVGVVLVWVYLVAALGNSSEVQAGLAIDLRTVWMGHKRPGKHGAVSESRNTFWR
jgi:hypothetical protein